MAGICDFYPPIQFLELLTDYGKGILLGLDGGLGKPNPKSGITNWYEQS